MATFVLVHGSFHGGWAWRDVARGLRREGHEVFAPTLTGLGERVHLLSARPTLELHAEDIANVLFFEDLQDVVLVGHSYAGFVITAAAELTDRIGQLVYLDAAMPVHGEPLLDRVPPLLRDLMTATAPGPVPTYTPHPAWLDTLPVEIRERLLPQPATDLERPILLPTRAAERLPRTFLAAGDSDLYSSLVPETRRPPWHYVEYPGSHQALLEDPDVIIDALLKTLAQPPTM